MKKKIGFIDLFIDEWHANNFPAWFRAATHADEFELTLAWEEAPAGGKPLAAWCAENGMTPANSIERVVEECDAFCVLAPSNPEAHERLAELPLRSGKPVYVDKSFAPDKAAAGRMFRLAEQHGTPLMSCSALRYSSELLKAQKEFLAGQSISLTVARGGGTKFAEYAIHQVEMIVALMGCGAKRVCRFGRGDSIHIVVEYPERRSASLTFHPSLPFALPAICGGKAAVTLDTLTEFFPNLIGQILEFFTCCKSPISSSETIEISAIVDAAVLAESRPGAWIDVK